MSEKMKRKFHRAQFKAKGGLEALQGIKTIKEIGQEFGVYPVHLEPPTMHNKSQRASMKTTSW